MYEYKLIITMSDGKKFYRAIGIREEKLFDDEKKTFIDSIFRNEHIDFSDYFVLNEDNKYVVLNTKQISYISVYETALL